MSTERTLYKYLVWYMGFSLRQANLFMCKARAISRGVAPYAIILLLTFSPLQREPHGPNINNLAIVLSLSVLICRMIQIYEFSGRDVNP